MSAVPKIDRAWSSRPPKDLGGLLEFVAREGLPIWRLLLTGFNQYFLGLIAGTIDIFGVMIRFGTGVPTAADPDGSVYVRTDPPTGTTWLYYRFGGAWVIFAGGGAGVTSVTAGAGLTDTGTATDPIINASNADGSLAIAADDIAVSAAIQAGASLGTTAVQPSRQVIAGAGQVGGGTLAGDVTLDVVAADPTIIVNADSIQVGVISEANVDDTIATEEDLVSTDDKVDAIIEALGEELEILIAIDEKISQLADEPAFGD